MKKIALTRRRQVAGMTLVEVIASTAIMLVLMSIGALGWKIYIKRAQEAVCRSNLRVLHSAFNGYVTEVGYWPQVPESLGEEPHHYYDWLIGCVSPYGGSRKAWVCPADENNKSSNTLGDDFVGSYIATEFKKGPQVPWTWASQPWVVETNDNHTKGALLIFPDGSIHTDKEVRGQ